MIFRIGFHFMTSGQIVKLRYVCDHLNNKIVWLLEANKDMHTSIRMEYVLVI